MSDLTICGTAFPVLFDKDGIEHVKVKDLCEPFGLDLSGQRERLKGAAWATIGLVYTIRSNGKRYPVPCIPLEQVPMFYATLDVGRVNDESRPALVAMQKEVARAVFRYFAHGGAIRPEAALPQLLELQRFIEQMIRKEPATDPVWPPRFSVRYESWHGRHWKEGDRPPYSMQSANDFFYQMIFPPEVYAVLKAKGLEAACRYHQLLTDEPRGYLRRHLEEATKLAEECSSEIEWRARMRRWYGKTKAQLAGQAALGI